MCPPLLLPAAGGHPPCLCPQAVLGNLPSLPQELPVSLLGTRGANCLLSPVRAHLGVQVGHVLCPLAVLSSPCSHMGSLVLPPGSVLTSCLHPTSQLSSSSVLAQQVRVKPCVYSGVMHYR